MSAPAFAPAAPKHVLFVTGKLAEPALQDTLASMSPPFAYDVAVLRITVAALMTTAWIAKHLDIPPGTDLVLIPGLCEGDVSEIVGASGVRVEKGPKDLREIPEYFGQAAARRDYGAYDIEIIAEIKALCVNAVEDAVAFAKGSATPDPASAASYVFAEGSPR